MEAIYLLIHPHPQSHRCPFLNHLLASAPPPPTVSESETLAWAATSVPLPLLPGGAGCQGRWFWLCRWSRTTVMVM
ncbi:hypothetical protein DAI22_02g113500 [Oryza sativa Japonica Group]|nr:hypothetical protein DAI22_02g113500 [Oryza sativa Japonica Group]